MKHAFLWAAIGILGILTGAGPAASPDPKSGDDQGFTGGSYLITLSDSAGGFISRGVITLHADRTMSVIDSGQGGPAFFFSSQLGSWKPRGNRGILARTIDFDFPPSPNVVARLDFDLTLSPDRSRISGAVTITYFPIETDPLGGGGTVIGTISLAGEWIKP